MPFGGAPVSTPMRTAPRDWISASVTAPAGAGRSTAATQASAISQEPIRAAHRFAIVSPPEYSSGAM